MENVLNHVTLCQEWKSCQVAQCSSSCQKIDSSSCTDLQNQHLNEGISSILNQRGAVQGVEAQPNAICGLSRPLLPQQQKSTILLKNALLAESNLLSECNATGQPIPSGSGVTNCDPTQNTALQSWEQNIQFATAGPYSDYTFINELKMNTVGSTTPLLPQPNQITADSPVQWSKEWQQSLDTELRSHTRHKIALAIAPTPDVYTKLLENHDIVGFVVKLESEMYDISDSLSEYCKLADNIMFYFKEIPYETYFKQKQATKMPLQPFRPQQQQMIPVSKVLLDKNNSSYAWQHVVPLSSISSTNHVPAQNAALQSQEKGTDLATACPTSPQNTGRCWHQQFTSVPAIGTQLSAPSSPVRAAAVGSVIKARLLPELIPLSTPYCDFNTESYCKNLQPCHDIADPVQPHFAQTHFQSFHRQQSEPPSNNPVLSSNMPWIEESEEEQLETGPRSGMEMVFSTLCSLEGMVQMPNELIQQLQQIFDMVPLSLDRVIEPLYQSLPGWSRINVVNNSVNTPLPFSRANKNLNVSQQQYQ